MQQSLRKTFSANLGIRHEVEKNKKVNQRQPESLREDKRSQTD